MKSLTPGRAANPPGGVIFMPAPPIGGTGK